jgi:hypothetical protein
VARLNSASNAIPPAAARPDLGFAAPASVPPAQDSTGAFRFGLDEFLLGHERVRALVVPRAPAVIPAGSISPRAVT